MTALVRIADRIRRSLAAQTDPGRAPAMQAYMKSPLPYYGVRMPAVAATVRSILHECGDLVRDRDDWEGLVRELFDAATHREEWYAALMVAKARRFASYQSPQALPLYRHLILTGGWWDVVDDVAHRVGDVLRGHREDTTTVLLRWSTEEDRWLRRTSIICQLGHRGDTDVRLLTSTIDANLGDPDFFLRKAIGWALREYAKTDPEWVGSFVAARDGTLSALSRREALKHLT